VLKLSTRCVPFEAPKRSKVSDFLCQQALSGWIPQASENNEYLGPKNAALQVGNSPSSRSVPGEVSAVVTKVTDRFGAF
jgi:hypothetical protein